MYKTLFMRHFYALVLGVWLCSFAYFNMEAEVELEKNELSYSDTKIELNFGGLEELVSSEKAACFRTDIYLSDVDLNDANLSAREQIVMVLKNYMNVGEFKNGTYRVMANAKSGESCVKAELFTLNGLATAVEVISGEVEYQGEYPQVNLSFDLLLSNGEHLRGNYSKKMETFKYFF